MTEDSHSTRRAVLITGASTGIGRACAVHLASRGWEVFAGVRSDADAASVEGEHDAIHGQLLDVTDAESIAAARVDVERRLGDATGLGGVVNNAGIVVPGPLEFVPIDELRRQFEVNTIGPVAVAQAFLPMLRRSGGRIVNIGSISGRISTPMMGPYAGSKFAIEAMSDALRNELAGSGVAVVLVDPGNISTPIWEKSAEFGESMLETMPPECEEHYGALIERTREMARRNASMSIPAERVARAVSRALSIPRPRPRYFVGLDAKSGSLLARLAPDRLRDLIVRRVIGV